jgi:hypothetical protein
MPSHETNIEGAAQEASPFPIVGLNYAITPFLQTKNKNTPVLTPHVSSLQTN